MLHAAFAPYRIPSSPISCHPTPRAYSVTSAAKSRPTGLYLTHPSPFQPRTGTAPRHASTACIGTIRSMPQPRSSRQAVYFTPTRPSLIRTALLVSPSPRVDHTEPSFHPSHSPQPSTATSHASRTPPVLRHTLSTSLRYTRADILFFSNFFFFFLAG